MDPVSLKVDDPVVVADEGLSDLQLADGSLTSDVRSNEGASDSHEKVSSKKSKKHKKDKKSKKHKKRRDSSSEGEPKVRNELEDFLNGGSNHNIGADAGNYEEL